MASMWQIHLRYHLMSTIRPSPICCLFPVDEVMAILNKSPEKLSLHDPIPTKLLKRCIVALIQPMTSIVNSSILSGIVPSTLK